MTDMEQFDLHMENEELSKELERLRAALARQSGNMAFVINHFSIPSAWYSKFERELEEDRAALKRR